MGVDLDGGAVRVVGAVERELEVLEGEAAAGGAGGRPVGHGALPANVGDVGAVGQGHGLLREGVVDVGPVGRGGGVALLDEPDLDGLDAPAEAGGAGLLAVLGPGHPADVGGVDAVVDVVVLGEGAREPQAHRLDGAALAGGAALGGRGGFPALPADATYIGVYLHRAIFNRIQDADLKILYGLRLSRCTRSGSIALTAHPANIRDMRLILNMHLAVVYVQKRTVEAVVHVAASANARNIAAA